MAWCFRVRLNLRGSSKLECGDEQWVIRDDGERVWLASADGPEPRPLADARLLALRGSEYPDQDAAMAAGEVWQHRLMYAFACMRVGADFGKRAPQGGFTQDGLAMLAGERAIPVVNDVHGVMAFPCEPAPVFVRIGPVAGVASASQPHERLVKAMSAALNAPGLDPAAREAYDLFSSSFDVPSADARLALLMMAFEVLLDLQPRHELVTAHVDRLITNTRNSDLPTEEIDSLAGALNWMRSESIRQGGRRLAGTLQPKRYGGMSPSHFFTYCYDLRSQLMHGAYPLPTRAQVDPAAAGLEIMVSDLLCRRGAKDNAESRS